MDLEFNINMIEMDAIWWRVSSFGDIPETSFSSVKGKHSTCSLLVNQIVYKYQLS